MTKVVHVRANRTIVVFGCGAIGMLFKMVSNVYGAKKGIIGQATQDFAKHIVLTIGGRNTK
jgi:threonine dehydrogenase-like Zn-dependent dehydrogenase